MRPNVFLTFLALVWPFAAVPDQNEHLSDRILVVVWENLGFQTPELMDRFLWTEELDLDVGASRKSQYFGPFQVESDIRINLAGDHVRYNFEPVNGISIFSFGSVRPKYFDCVRKMSESVNPGLQSPIYRMPMPTDWYCLRTSDGYVARARVAQGRAKSEGGRGMVQIHIEYQVFKSMGRG